jgi:hypothetical protein
LIPYRAFYDIDPDDYMYLYCDKSNMPSYVNIVTTSLGFRFNGTVPAAATINTYPLFCTISDSIGYNPYTFVF